MINGGPDGSLRRADNKAGGCPSESTLAIDYVDYMCPPRLDVNDIGIMPKEEDGILSFSNRRPENGEEYSESEVELDEQSEEDEAEKRKPFEFGDFLTMIIKKEAGGQRRKIQRKNKKKPEPRLCQLTPDEFAKIKAKTLALLGEKKEEKEEAPKSSALSLSLFAEEKEAKQRLCQLTPDEVGTIKANLAEFVPLDDDRNGLLPSHTSILQRRSNAKDGTVSAIFPHGALLIVRKDPTEDKYLLNPLTTFCPSDADQNTEQQQKLKVPKKPMEVTQIASSNAIFCKGSSSFLSDLLSNMRDRKGKAWLVENEPFSNDAEIDAEAERLLLSELEQQMDADDQRNGLKDQPSDGMPYSSAPSSALSAVASSYESSVPLPAMLKNGISPLPTLCDVCFAECFDSFALRRCEEFGATHIFCDDCWRQHIVQCLISGRVPIRCMALHCVSVVRPSVALLVVGQSIVQWYRQLLCKRRRLCRDFVVCAQCDGTVRLRLNWRHLSSFSHKLQPLAKCAHCEEIICCRCAHRQHLPLSCEERELYELILRSHGHSLQSLFLSSGINRIVCGVRCENCNNLVEKNKGCDHIVCVCGYEFCWRCGGDWKRHRNCVGHGRINVLLFDLVFINGANGKKLEKTPEKFFAECAEFRALRHPNGRKKLFKQMDKIFAKNPPKGRQWAAKYLQVSEFVELCLAKRQISGKRTDDFSAATDRLRFTFRSLPFIAKMSDGATSKLISEEMVEQTYEQMVAISKHILLLSR